ncbi:3'-5' exonuclease [Sphingomonas beigongshangi]|jgi:DNA polymerase III subunit epsilon|uniref:3'-5' exonuclease n=1 Tax=Sphingomonas beigongshangi TaxID=2782540 RepID=UPI001AEF27F4|nr:3'-5' exonuclease [Sphingomonas beigongshangi]
MTKLALAGRESAAGDEESRVLHRLDLTRGPTGEGRSPGPFVGVSVDVETTGLDFESDAIIELALRRFRYDAEGIVTDLDMSRSWLEDPRRSISLETTAITGLTDADLVGRFVDDDIATAVLRSADLVVAHNSRFDRPWVERRLEGATGLAWGCSMEQVDWRAAGFDGRGLGYLLCQAGWYHSGHRAAADADAVVQLLRHRFPDGTTALSQLVARTKRSSWVVTAVGADFGVKDLLRARGYRWDPVRRAWWREIVDEARLDEELWLARHVYAPEAKPRAMGPEIEERTATTRFL